MAPEGAVPYLVPREGLGAGAGRSGDPPQHSHQAQRRSLVQGCRCQLRTGHGTRWSWPGSMGCLGARGTTAGGDALPEAQHSPGRRDRAASPPVQRQFYNKWHFD